MEEFNINLSGIYQVKWQNNGNQQSALIISKPTLGIRDDVWGEDIMRSSKRLKSSSVYIKGMADNIRQPPYSDPKFWTQLEEDNFRIEHALSKIIPEQFLFEEFDNQKSNDAVEVIKMIEHCFSILYYNISTSSAVLIPDNKPKTALHASSPDRLDCESIYWVSKNADILFNIVEDEISAYVKL